MPMQRYPEMCGETRSKGPTELSLQTESHDIALFSPGTTGSTPTTPAPVPS